MKERLLSKLRLKKSIVLCEQDPIYFLSNYANCMHYEKGTVPFVPFSYQEEYIEAISKGNTIVAAARQAGTSLTTTLYLFWEGFFQRKTQGFVSNRIEQSEDNLQSIRHAYLTMPSYMRDYNPMVVNNKQRLVFANGSSFAAFPATEHAFRGTAINTLFMDHFSGIRSSEAVVASAMPSVFHRHNGKMIIVSSGDSSDTFNKMYYGAIEGSNPFTAIRIVPDQIP